MTTPIDIAPALASDDAALHSGCGLADCSARGILVLAGSERVSFLHGLVTNDVKALAPGRWLYCALLTPKGQMLSDGRVLARPGDLFLDLPAGRADPVRAHLERHLISEDVEIADVTADLVCLSVIGPRTWELLSTAPIEDRHFEHRDGSLLVASTLGALPCCDLFAPPARIASVRQELLARGALPVGEPALELARIEAGIPLFGQEMDEETIPLEAGITERAISFTKGCYVGQEVIARAYGRGGMRRKLVGYRLEGAALPPARSPLFAAVGDAKPAGELSSVAMSPRFGAIALGFARREHQAAGTTLVTQEGRKATVCALPFK